MGSYQVSIIHFLNRPAEEGGGVIAQPTDLEVSTFSCAAPLIRAEMELAARLSRLPAVDALQGPPQAA